MRATPRQLLRGTVSRETRLRGPAATGPCPASIAGGLREQRSRGSARRPADALGATPAPASRRNPPSARGAPAGAGVFHVKHRSSSRPRTGRRDDPPGPKPRAPGMPGLDAARGAPRRWPSPRDRLREPCAAGPAAPPSRAPRTGQPALRGDRSVSRETPRPRGNRLLPGSAPRRGPPIPPAPARPPRPADPPAPAA